LLKHDLCATAEPVSVKSILEKLLDLQEGSSQTATHKLTRDHLHPITWQKMGVNFSLEVIEEKVAAALQIRAFDGELV